MLDLCICMNYVISEFDGSHAFCTLVLFLCSILCLVCSGSSLHVTCILPFRDIVVVCVKNDVFEDNVCSMYIWWWLNVRESSLSVCRKLCPVCFLVVSEDVPVLL